MPLTKAQTNILQLAIDNEGIFNPSTSNLRGGALNKVITALQNKKLIKSQTKKGYPLSDLGFERMDAKKSNTTTEKTLPAEARKGTKTEKLIKLLNRKNGATNAQIQSALNWLPHSVRGIISGTLKKKMGLTISTEKNKSGDLVYRIAD